MPIQSVEDPTPPKTEDTTYVWKPSGVCFDGQLIQDPNLELGRMLLFTHGIDLAKDIARNSGVTATVDWLENTVTLTSQDVDLIAQAVQRFTKLEEFYVQTHLRRLKCRTVLVCLSSTCRLCCV